MEIRQDLVGGEESISMKIKKDAKTGERLSEKKLVLSIEKPKYTDVQPIHDQEYFFLKVKELAKLQFEGFDDLELRKTTWQKKPVYVATIPSGVITYIYVWHGANMLSATPTAYSDDISLDLKILPTVKFAE